MSSFLQIRPMLASDLPAARALWAGTEGVELAEGDSLAELAAYLQRNPGLSFVATHGNHLAGALLAGHDGRRGFLYHLAVDRNQRGAGIGTALVDHAIAALKSAGVVRVLILVACDNQAGRAFWARRGWESLTFAEPMGRNL